MGCVPRIWHYAPPLVKDSPMDTNDANVTRLQNFCENFLALGFLLSTRGVQTFTPIDARRAKRSGVVGQKFKFADRRPNSKNGNRVSCTVCMGTRDSFAQNLGGGSRSAGNLTFVSPSPPYLFDYLLPCIYFAPRYNIKHANALVGVCS